MPTGRAVIDSPRVVDRLPRHRLVAWLVGGNLAVFALLAALTALGLHASHRAYTDLARDTTEGLAASLQQAVGAQLAQADLVLRGVDIALRQAGLPQPVASETAHRILDDRLALVPAIARLCVAGTDGTLRFARGEAAPQRCAQLAAQRLLPDGLAISEPVQPTSDQPWVISLSRRLETQDGALAGVVHADIPVERFQKVLAGVDVGADGAITLRSASLRLIARHASRRGDAPAVGSANVSASLAEAVQADPVRGFYVSRTALDEVERTTAYRRVGDYPLLLLIGIGTAEIFAPWRHQATQMTLLLGVATLLIVGASLVIFDAWRRQAEGARALLGEGRRNRALLRTASDGIHVLDRSGRIVELSDSFAAMLGSERNALLGRQVESWDAKFDPVSIRQWLSEQRTGGVRRFETLFRRDDGTLFDAEVQSVVTQIDGADLIFCSARDITERKRLQKRLADSLVEVRDLYDNAPCAYHSLDRNGRFVHVNATGLSWLGCSADELIGKRSIADFFTAQGRAQFAENFSRLVAGERLEGLEFDLVPEHGPPRRVSVSVTGIRDAAGEFVMSRSVMHDITALKDAEALRLNAVELQAENRQLRESSRLKSQFLGNMSHELRTPLNGILGFAQLLQQGDTAPAADAAWVMGHAARIEASGRHLLELIDSMLQYSQAESRRLAFRAQRVNLPVLVEEGVAAFRDEIGRKPLALATRFEPGTEQAMLDPLRLRQVLSTLLSNAVKFTAPGGHVQLRVSRDALGGLRFEVEDDGIGIAEMDLPKIFTEFQQLSTGTTKRYAGVGIGLALARRLVEAQGGRIEVRSTPGAGSVFSVVLPDAVSASATAA